jgi:hypothetical protein
VYDPGNTNHKLLTGSGPHSIAYNQVAFVQAGTIVSGAVIPDWNSKLVVLGTANFTTLPTNGLEIYNTGTLTVPTLTIESSAKFFNYGKITLSGLMTVDGQVDNKSTIIAPTVIVNGMSTFLNKGQLSVAQDLTVTASGTFDNSGHVTIGNDLLIDRNGIVVTSLTIINVGRNLAITGGGSLKNAGQVKVTGLTKIDGVGKYQALEASKLTTGSIDISSQLIGPATGSGLINVTGTIPSKLEVGVVVNGNINLCSPPGFSVGTSATILAGISQNCLLAVNEAVNVAVFGRELSDKTYEFSNHLGNVLTTVSDMKIGVDVNNDNLYDYYRAVIRSSQDYYAGGAPMPGRTFNANGYRYGHNTQEKVEELGSGHYTAEYWEYDSRLLRRWNREPIEEHNVFQSPYTVNFNNPISNTDPDGDNPIIGRLVTRALTSRAALRVGMRVTPIAAPVAAFLSNPSNVTLIKESAAFLVGMVYEGPDDICPDCKGDELSRVIRGLNSTLKGVIPKLSPMIKNNVQMKGVVEAVSRLADGQFTATNFGEKALAKVSKQPWFNYQKQINGIAGEVGFSLNGVSFDGMKGGTLLEAKGVGYKKLLSGVENIKNYVLDGWLNQAKRQVQAASGTGATIEWHFAEQEAADAFKNLLNEKAEFDISKIKIIVTPMDWSKIPKKKK